MFFEFIGGCLTYRMMRQLTHIDIFCLERLIESIIVSQLCSGSTHAALLAHQNCSKLDLKELVLTRILSEVSAQDFGAVQSYQYHSSTF